ncbi:MAG: hypothetical protein QOJ94_1779 [Sphingomonadales bacterium]|jgi:hypothetical protein|nr:hypothetical protein [Sphingomonadales bacterium]
MRKAILTILMAATAAAPALAQDNDGGWRGRGHRDDNSQTSEQRSEARAERVQQREQAQQQREQAQQPRVERQQAAPQQQTEARSWQGRSGGTWQRGEAQQPAVQVQQQQQVRTEAYRGSRGGNWNGGDRNAQRFQAEREAAQRSAEQTVGGNYARRAQENERNYERQTLRREGQRDNRSWDGNRGNYDRGSYRNDRNRSYNWSRDWRNDNRYDWQRYRYSNRSIFNPGRYYAPYRGYGYNRLSIGLVLDELFFGRNYWIDPLYYHLPPAPPGTEWVRYYNDVVLVDVYSGEVVDVIYDFFY